jgi:TRAP-type mannitol/chloroaromatic compound transport system permease small subunit
MAGARFRRPRRRQLPDRRMNSNESTLARLAHRIDLVAIVSGRIVAWLIVPMVLSLTFEVISRYLFNAPTVWAYDMTFMLYGSFFMIGAAFTLQRKGHIRTDSFYGEWSPRRQAWVDIVCYLVMFLPFAGVFLFSGWGYFVKAWVTHETFVSSPWSPITWPFKLMMPLTGLLLLIQGASECLKCLHAIRHDAWPDPPVSAVVASGVAV